MDNFEELVHEAHKLRGWAWVQSEPLWCTWTLERFGMYPLFFFSLIFV